MLFEEPDETADEIQKESLVGLLDMIYEEWVAKDSAVVADNQPKAFASADVLDILQTIYTECFRKVANFQVTMNDIDKGSEC